MNTKFKRMLCSHMINQKTPFEENVQATEDDIRKCLKFCWNMTYGAHGEHRDHRTGGIKKEVKKRYLKIYSLEKWEKWHFIVGVKIGGNQKYQKLTLIVLI